MPFHVIMPARQKPPNLTGYTYPVRIRRLSISNIVFRFMRPAGRKKGAVSLCCAVLCCAVLCCAVLCCAVLCCAVLCCAVLCCASLALFRMTVKSFLFVFCEYFRLLWREGRKLLLILHPVLLPSVHSPLHLLFYIDSIAFQGGVPECHFSCFGNGRY